MHCVEGGKAQLKFSHLHGFLESSHKFEITQNTLANTPEILHSADIICYVQDCHYMTLSKPGVNGELVETCLFRKTFRSIMICKDRISLARVQNLFTAEGCFFKSLSCRILSDFLIFLMQFHFMSISIRASFSPIFHSSSHTI